MTIYDIDNITNVTNLYDLTKNVNTATDGLYIALSLLVFFFVLFIGMKRYETKSVLLASSFIMFIVTSVFAFLKLVQFDFAVIAMVVFFAFLILKMVWRE